MKNALKRLFDIILAFLSVFLFLLPLILIIPIIKLAAGDFTPLFYTQKRFGRGGRRFTMIKFRSLTGEKPTKVGKFLREHSIDEIPQVLNILAGHMSFIGPRPYLLREKSLIEPWFGRITRVRPGLSGPYQVYGRHKLTIEERAEMEAKYAENPSFAEDARIFFLSLKAPFRAEK